LRLPQFIIGGAPRCGTTWLYRLADRHASLAMAKPVTPEPKFFLVDSQYERGLSHYSETWFANLPADRTAGEKSTNYLESSLAAARISQDLPNVKMIFILRNPVDRAYSNFLWSTINGLETESFEQALALERMRESTLPEALRYARPFSYFSRGLYATMLEPWLKLFPRSQMLILKTEDIASSPRAVAGRLYEFLEVASLPELSDGLGIVNASEPGLAVLDRDVRLALEDRYREPNMRLQKMLGANFQPW
ncbi:MAG: sulfotransferase domain-containing protein, partial [Candidatus Eremiobacteraeota bacterium]|nr:sulfotransferase domain-containing protein [Candidatus Eremiobacteraeota bacterium]